MVISSTTIRVRLLAPGIFQAPSHLIYSTFGYILFQKVFLINFEYMTSRSTNTKILGTMAILAWAFIFSAKCFAVDPPQSPGGTQGGNSHPTGACPRSSKKGTCYNSFNSNGEDNDTGGGGEWLRISKEEINTDKNRITYNWLRGKFGINEESGKRGNISWEGDPQVITGCGDADNIYVFIGHIFQNQPPYQATGEGYGPHKFHYLEIETFHLKKDTFIDLKKITLIIMRQKANILNT